MLCRTMVCCHNQQLLLVLLLLLASAASIASSINCDWQSSNGENKDGWVPHGASCYKWTEALDYWYPAEQTCKSSGGHLVSISSEQENTLVGRLSYCLPTWIGRYGLDMDKLSDPTNYRWTSGITSSFERHNTSRLKTPHQPLVTAENLEWQNNFYHDRNGYLCEAPASPPADNRTGETAVCPDGWRRFGDNCYLQPGFQATYIEAGFYCEGKQAQLVSVHSDRELRLLSLLDLGLAACSIELWVGLVKLNPCRTDFSNGRQQQICYRWADRSDDYRGFPRWDVGHPNGDLVTNCAVLKDRNLRSKPCHMRHSFVCKRSAETTPPPPTRPPTHPPTRDPTQLPTQPPTRDPTQPPTQPPTRPPPSTQIPPGKVQAAYDFRRSTANLALPGRYRIQDVGSAVIGPQGAIFNGSVGILVDTEASALTKPLKQDGAWTLFYYTTRATDYDELLVDIGGSGGEPSLTLLENPGFTDLSMYGSTGYFRDESDKQKGSANQQQWLRVAIVFEAKQANFYRNWVDVSTHSPATSTFEFPDNDEHMMLGNAYGSVLPGYRGVLACFGIAHVALTPEELATAFQRYCP